MKKILVLVLSFALCLSLAIPALASEHDGYADALYALGLFRGTWTAPDGSPVFALDESSTRVQALVMLIRLLGEEEAALACTETHPFIDVPEDHWADRYVAYGYAKKYTNGTWYNAFAPDTPATANMYLTYLLRALGYDDAAGDFSYTNAIAKAEAVGLIPEDTYFNGAAPFKRDDCAYASYRALGTKLKGGVMTLAEKLEEKGVFSAKDYSAARPTSKRTLWLQTAETYTGSDGSSYHISNTYDSLGRMLSCQIISNSSDGSSQTSTYTYNANGSLTSAIIHRSDGSSESTLYTYDTVGNLVFANSKASDGRSRIEVYTYDEKGRELSQTIDDSEYGSSASTTTYDSEGRILTESSVSSDGASSTCSFTYDAMGRVAAETQTYIYGSNGESLTATLEHSYDDNGNLLRTHREDDGGTVSDLVLTYDGEGQLLSESLTTNGVLNYTETYAYDAAGNRVSDSSSDADGSSWVETYTYDGEGRPLSYIYSDASGSSTSSAYIYDDMGNLLSYACRSSDGALSTETHTYSADGYCLSTRYTSNYDGVEHISDATYTYDSAGNLLSEEYAAGKDSSSTIYEYISVTVTEEG